MDGKISQVILESTDRPDLGSISFSLYSEGIYILERMDGWSSISSINTEVEPYQLRDGSHVSDQNSIGGKIITNMVHIRGDNETLTIKSINTINGILRSRMKLTVVDDGEEYYLDEISLISGSYNLERVAPNYYTLEFGLAAKSAYKIRSEMMEKVISGGGEVISGGIIYPTFQPYDDEVSYPDYVHPYNTTTSIQQGRIVIEGNGDIYPYFVIEGTFYSVTISFVSPLGEKKNITLVAQGDIGDQKHHIWTLNTERLEAGFLTPNYTGDPDWSDAPYIEQADWFKLSVGQNEIKSIFDGSGTVTAKWQERIL